MCGIVGFLDKLGRPDFPTGAIVLAMLDALACRGPDGAGIAALREPGSDGLWRFRVAPNEHVASPVRDPSELGGLDSLGTVIDTKEEGDTLLVTLRPHPGLSVAAIEPALGACRGRLEVLCAGERIDLVKQVGSPSQLEAAYGVSAWRGPLAVGHTRMSTESRIDLSHSQPFWAHGLPDVATVHNGHITNYHRLRRHYEQRGVVFYTDNDSEVIGVYLRDRLERGRTFSEALADSLDDLDGAYNYLVAAPEGLGVVRDRFGFKPLVVAETDAFVAVATEEVALRRALPGAYRVHEPPPGRASVYTLPEPVPA
jgi:glutamine phosphoribosylpyrophosphate amidotransferase